MENRTAPAGWARGGGRRRRGPDTVGAALKGVVWSWSPWGLGLRGNDEEGPVV